MRKDLGNKMNFLPLPVLMIGTYDKDGKANIRFGSIPNIKRGL